MPPKKKRKPRPTQSQKQSQRVTVNIGSTKSAPRKKSSGGGGGGSRQPSTYSHNLAPTFITAPPVDYTPLLAMIQHHARPIVEQQPIAQTQTPLSSVTQATAQQMAGVAAEERRAGPTAGSFQPPPSQARERAEEDRVAVTPSVKPPDAPPVFQSLPSQARQKGEGSVASKPVSDATTKPASSWGGLHSLSASPKLERTTSLDSIHTSQDLKGFNVFGGISTTPPPIPKTPKTRAPNRSKDEMVVVRQQAEAKKQSKEATKQAKAAEIQSKIDKQTTLPFV